MIQIETIYLPSAAIGRPNPLPDIKNNTYIHASIRMTERITAQERVNIGCGMIPTMLPYMTQDGYDRCLTMQPWQIIVLENEYLRAEFLPALGGRLRRLYDKVDGRELLYVNPVFQPCNLALRNAWFSGGVEFNVGIKGHNPLTCSPVFAQRRVNAHGEEYVSFYEYERIRGVLWSVNAYLPAGARALTLHMCIENTSADDIYMYWWSNMAVTQTDGMRVLVPAEQTFINYFGDDAYVLDAGDVPYSLGTDISYPLNMMRSIDFFYKIPPTHRKWIASVDRDGRGLLHMSDERLLGRKTFLWGQGRGGRHFGEYLSREGEPNYIEIQAGLAPTQLEHFPMAAHTRIEWTESYAPLSCDAEAVHGAYADAVATVERVVAEHMARGALYTPPLCASASLRESEMLHRGSGWAALAQQVRGEALSAFFDDLASDDPSCAEYVHLLTHGILPPHAPCDPPCGYVNGRHFVERLRASLTRPGGDTYYTHLLLGVALYDLGCRGDAEAMAACYTEWETSARMCENPWAYRNMAAYLARERGDGQAAIPYAIRAWQLKPDDRALVIDTGTLLLSEGAYERFLTLSDALPEPLRSQGRIALMRAKAYLSTDRIDEAATILTDDLQVPDIKEGELSISELWFTLQAKRHGISVEEAKRRIKLPYALDFRVHDDASPAP